MRAAEQLAIVLIAKPMTVDEISRFLGTGKGRAKQVIADMRRNVLPDLQAWCPRPTRETGYVYRVMATEGFPGYTATASDTAIQQEGARVMLKDNHRRLVSMLEMAEPYANVLDARTREGRAARVYAKAASAALASLELIESE